MTPKSPQTAHPPDSDWQAFLNLARQASETIGAEFLSMLTRRLAGVLGAKCVYVAEFMDGKTKRVRTLAAFAESGRFEAFEFPLAGSPDAEVTEGNSWVYPRGVREMFPKDPLLCDLDAAAWVGVPLNNSEGRASGIIAAIYAQPLQLEVHFVQSMLTMFAPRASAELNRKQAEDALRESEQRYRAFVQMNPDACWRVEFDEPIDTALPEEEQVAKLFRYGRVAECNDAAGQRLGLERADQLIGVPITEAVLDPETAHGIMLSMIRSEYRTARWRSRK